MKAFLIVQMSYQLFVCLVMAYCLLNSDDTFQKKMASLISMGIASAFGIWALVLLVGGAQ